MKTGDSVSRTELLEKGWEKVYSCSYKYFQVFEKGKIRIRWNHRTKMIVRKYRPKEEIDILKQGWRKVHHSKAKNWKMFTRVGATLFWDSESKEVIKIFEHEV